jgi:NAD-dependent DNA ligase
MDMLKRARIDGAISEMGAIEIDRWLRENKRVLYAWPMSAIECRMRSVMEDGWISQEELADLRECAKQILSPDSVETQAPIPVFTTPAPAVRFNGKSFVFSGKFLLGTRTSCRDEIRGRGGEVRDTAARDVDYLVVGSRVNPRWANARYGRKIEAATHNISNGAHTAIISEEHLFESLR